MLISLMLLSFPSYLLLICLLIISLLICSDNAIPLLNSALELLPFNLLQSFLVNTLAILDINEDDHVVDASLKHFHQITATMRP